MSILIDTDSTFIIQGITGREAVTMTRELLDYGARVVGGVTPGRKGRDVHGVPVEDTVRALTEQTRVDGSIVAVPPAFAVDAVLEAIEAGVKLIVVVTERIPRAQVARAIEYASQEGARIIGPNCLGVISPGKSKMGGIGGAADATRRAFVPGVVGVMSRSGGMTTEIANALSEAGLGVSTAVSIGGDAMIGSSYAELMPLFEDDPETKGIAIYSEPGGPMEAQLAAHMAEHGSRLPVVAFMAGRFMDEMPGMRFGHAGTIVEGRADTTADKIARLEAAGIAVAERIEEIPALLRERWTPRTGERRSHGDVHPRRHRRIRAAGRRPPRAPRRGLPGRHLRPRWRAPRNRRVQPRRVHPLRPLHRGRGRRGAGGEAVRGVGRARARRWP